MSEDIFITEDGKAVTRKTLQFGDSGRLFFHNGKEYLDLGTVKDFKITYKPETEDLL